MKLRNLIFKHSEYVSAIGLIILCRTALVFVGPVILKQVIDSIERDGRDGILASIAIFIGAFILLNVFGYVYNHFFTKFSLNFKFATSVDLYGKLFGVKYHTLQQKEPTYFVNRIKQFADNAFNLVGDNLANAAVSIVTITVALFFIHSISTNLFLLSLLLLPVGYFGYKKVNRKLMLKSQDLQHICAENFKDIINVTRNVDEIKQLHNYPAFSALVGKYIFAIEKQNSDTLLYAKNISLIAGFASDLMKNAILLVMIYLLYIRVITFSDIIFMTMILSIYFSSLADLNRVNISFGALKASMNFISEYILNAQEQNSGIKTIGKVCEIELNIPSFAYPDGKNILSDIQIKMRRGEKIALVGKSGCGKSTLLKLLNRLYDCSGIMINSADIAEYPLRELRERIYVVSQSPKMFPGTLRDNILIGLADAGIAGFSKIENLPFLREFSELPAGFDTLIKEGGTNFSGGQKQKIMIARMLMRNPDVIVFDESTSAVDSRGEEEIFSSISEMLKDKLVIFISHRLSTIRKCDSAAVIKSGRIDKFGPIKEVLEQDGEFKNIFEAQMG